MLHPNFVFGKFYVLRGSAENFKSHKADKITLGGVCTCCLREKKPRTIAFIKFHEIPRHSAG